MDIKLSRWLVALDRSEMDNRLIDHVHYWATVFKPDKISFINVRRELESWDHVDNTLFNKMLKKEKEEDAIWVKSIEEKIKHFETSTYVTVGHGAGLEKLMEICSDYKYDLVIAGKKQAMPSQGHLTEDLAKKLPTSFMLIPETATKQCDRILVPTDFSEYSFRALKFAHELKKADKNRDLLPANVYQVPSGYHFIGMKYEEFAGDMKANALEGVENQLKKVGIEAEQILVRLREHRSNAEHLQNMAIDAQADLIILGSKGMTQSAYILMGSTAARMMRHMGRAPLLILKRFGETYDLFKAIGHLLDPDED